MGKLGLIWRVGGYLMAINTESVIEVLPPVSCRPMSGTPDWIRGLFVYRGTLIPLVEMSRLLGQQVSPDRLSNRVLVVKMQSPGIAIEWPLGIWVESVMEVERLDSDSKGGHPGLATDQSRFLGPVIPTRWGQVQFVNPSEFFTPEQARIMTQRLSEEAA